MLGSRYEHNSKRIMLQMKPKPQASVCQDGSPSAHLKSLAKVCSSDTTAMDSRCGYQTLKFSHTFRLCSISLFPVRGYEVCSLGSRGTLSVLRGELGSDALPATVIDLSGMRTHNTLSKRCIVRLLSANPWLLNIALALPFFLLGLILYQEGTDGSLTLELENNQPVLTLTGSRGQQVRLSVNEVMEEYKFGKIAIDVRPGYGE